MKTPMKKLITSEQQQTKFSSMCLKGVIIASGFLGVWVFFFKLFFKHFTLSFSALSNKKRNSQYLMETESDNYLNVQKKSSKLKQTENFAGDLIVIISREQWIFKLSLVFPLLLTEVVPLTNNLSHV